MDFLVCIIASLKQENVKNTYFTDKLNCVKLNITGNRLSELSQYAITPKCLETFLRMHIKKDKPAKEVELAVI